MSAILDEVFRTQRQRLWTLCYRLTGSAEADDLVQECFVQAIEKPPSDDDLARRLVGAATNLAVNELRRRKADEYSGDWLPSPIDTEEGIGFRAGIDAPPVAEPESRYDLVESTSFPFLVALEALAPIPRAVLILADALAYAAADIATIFDTSEADVRAAHERAQLGMQPHHVNHRSPTQERQERTRATLEQFMESLERQDAPGAEALLAERARSVTDWGGTYTALPESTTGRASVAHAHLQAHQQRAGLGVSTEIRVINSLPALLLQVDRPGERDAPNVVLRCDLDDDGRIARLDSILAPAKLSTIRFARED